MPGQSWSLFKRLSQRLDSALLLRRSETACYRERTRTSTHPAGTESRKDNSRLPMHVQEGLADWPSPTQEIAIALPRISFRKAGESQREAQSRLTPKPARRVPRG